MTQSRSRRPSLNVMAFISLTILIILMILLRPAWRPAILGGSMITVALLCFGTLAYKWFCHVSGKSPLAGRERSFRSFDMATLESVEMKPAHRPPPPANELEENGEKS